MARLQDLKIDGMNSLDLKRKLSELEKLLAQQMYTKGEVDKLLKEQEQRILANLKSVDDWKSVRVSPWIKYAPSVGGNITHVNGTIWGKYRFVGDEAEIRCAWQMGASDTMGTSTVWAGFTIPQAVRYLLDQNLFVQSVGDGVLYDAGVGYWRSLVCWEAGAGSYPTWITCFTQSTNSIRAPLDTTTPFTWAAGDGIEINISIPLVNGGYRTG